MNSVSQTLWPWVVLWWPWLLTACLTGGGVLFGLWWLWWRLPKRQVDRVWFSISDAKARADVEDNFRKTITQLVSTVVVLFGGTAALIGGWLAYSGTQQTIRANADQARRSEQASHDLLISNQVSKGFEQFGSDNIRVRLGGIYALEGVMNDSNSMQYYLPVLEALSAFVRDSTRTETGAGPPATDIQAALTVIGRRKVIGAAPNLANAQIPKADLRFAKLTSALLEHANLTDANLFGANLLGADLRDADLRGAKDLTQGELDHACGDKNTKLDPPLTITPCPATAAPR